jgi:MoxR-like ATPase
MAVKYIPSEPLLKAKEVAAYLNRPLLLSGEPGTGKTKFAEYVEDSEKKSLYIFNTKSVSLSKDLFYNYDAIGHFAEKEKSAVEFITLEALGHAIVNATGKERVAAMLLQEPTNNRQLIKLREQKNCNEIVERFLKKCSNKSSVVLIDEVDKAPRDFPNDILNEIENMEFEIKELGIQLNLSKEEKAIKDKIFVLLTSNFEKNLPEAFLRRCIYHHIEFVENVDYLKKIINVHVKDIDQNDLANRINEFLEIRKHNAIQKKPATSELIDCVKWLGFNNSIGTTLWKNNAALSTLLKKNEDLKLFAAQS